MSKHSAQLAALRHIASRLTGDGQLINLTRGLVNRVDAAAAALVKLNDEPDPMSSELAISMRIEAARLELKKLVAESKEKTAALVATERANLATNRAQQANLQPSAHAQEIRSVFRQLDTGAKLRFLDAAIESRDGETIASLVTVPLSISGLTAEQSSAYKKMYLEKVAPLDDRYVSEVADASTGVFDCAAALVA